MTTLGGYGAKYYHGWKDHLLLPGHLEQYMTWAKQTAKGKTQSARIFRLVFAEVVHSVWIERNTRVFEGKRRP